MTQEERQMLTDLASKIASTPSPAHDAEAEELIRTKIGSRPDALYLMTQTVLIQNLAIEHAREQIQELQQKAGQQPQQGAPQPSFAPQPSYAPQQPPAYAPPPPSYAPPPPSGMSSFLHSAATTAAGVAAGALAFEGIRSLFGGHLGGFGGGGMQGGSFLGGTPETIVNNYYDSPERGGRDDTGSEDRDDDLQASGDDATQSADSADATDNSGTDSGGDSGGSDSGGSSGSDSV
jgi:hypothetical protein